MEGGGCGPGGPDRPRPGRSVGLPIRRGDERSGPGGGTRRGRAPSRRESSGNLCERERGRSRGAGGRPACTRNPRTNRGEPVPPNGISREENRPDPRTSGARNVLGPGPNARIPGIESKRALSHRDGIFGADVVLVPLEDGDRAEALVRMGKAVISIDLNPLSRTSQRATIPIVDELRRAILNIKKFVEELKADPGEAARVRRAYRRSGNLGAVYSFLEWRLGHLRRGLVRGEKRSGAKKQRRAARRATGRHRQ